MVEISSQDGFCHPVLMVCCCCQCEGDDDDDEDDDDVGDGEDDAHDNLLCVCV